MPLTDVMRFRLTRPYSLCGLLVFLRFATTRNRDPVKGLLQPLLDASFPGNSKSSPLASDLLEDTKNKHNWDESLATLSEAAVLSSPFLSLLNQ